MSDDRLPPGAVRVVTCYYHRDPHELDDECVGVTLLGVAYPQGPDRLDGHWVGAPEIGTARLDTTKEKAMAYVAQQAARLIPQPVLVRVAAERVALLTEHVYGCKCDYSIAAGGKEVRRLDTRCISGYAVPTGLKAAEREVDQTP